MKGGRRRRESCAGERERERERLTQHCRLTSLDGFLFFRPPPPVQKKKKKKSFLSPHQLENNTYNHGRLRMRPQMRLRCRENWCVFFFFFRRFRHQRNRKTHFSFSPSLLDLLPPSKKKKKKPTASAAAPPAARSAAARSARARRRRPSEGTAALGARVAAPGAALAAPGASARPRAALRRPKEKSNEAEEGRGDVLISVGFFLFILVGPKRKKRGENNKKGKK